MPVDQLSSTTPLGTDAGAGSLFAALTGVTHVANFAFVVVAGRLLEPGDFGILTALMGTVLLGLAPGMALQALTTVAQVEGPVAPDRALARRLAAVVLVVVGAVTGAAAMVLDVDPTVALLAVPVAAALLPLTGANEGVLQGNHRFVALGSVMAAGATAKLVVGTAGLVATRTLEVALLAIAVGYGVQVWLSHRAVDRARLTAPDRLARPAYRYAVVVVGALLTVAHLDALVAPAVLSDVEAGRYAVGVVATRVTFWLPQFAILLLFPRLARRPAPRTLLRIGAVVALLAAVGVAAATVLGAPLARLAFEPALATVGPDLWRFVWLGGALLGLQVLALHDIAAARRSALPWLVAAGLWIPVSFVWLGPSTAPDAVTPVAAGLTAVVAVGLLAALRPAPRR